MSTHSDTSASREPHALFVAISVSSVQTGRADADSNSHSVSSLESIVSGLTDEILQSGFIPAYGGDWRLGGFSKLLAEVVRHQPAQRDGQPSNRLRNYLAPNIAASMTSHDRADMNDWCELVITEAAPAASAHSLRDELSLMRRQMATDCAARIVLGGRTEGYAGAVPGILEEGFWMQAFGKPVLALTGFGGAAAWFADAALLHAQQQRWLAHVRAHGWLSEIMAARFQQADPVVSHSGTKSDDILLAVRQFLRHDLRQ